MENEINVTIDNVVKIDTDEGDTLLVTMPDMSITDAYYNAVAKKFDEVLHGKDVRVVVIPYGMKVELIKSSALPDAK